MSKNLAKDHPVSIVRLNYEASKLYGKGIIDKPKNYNKKLWLFLKANWEETSCGHSHAHMILD